MSEYKFNVESMLTKAEAKTHLGAIVKAHGGTLDVATKVFAAAYEFCDSESNTRKKAWLKRVTDAKARQALANANLAAKVVLTIDPSDLVPAAAKGGQFYVNGERVEAGHEFKFELPHLGKLTATFDGVKFVCGDVESKSPSGLCKGLVKAWNKAHNTSHNTSIDGRKALGIDPGAKSWKSDEVCELLYDILQGCTSNDDRDSSLQMALLAVLEEAGWKYVEDDDESSDDESDQAEAA